MLSKGEPLSRELRFRLRAYMGIVLIGFFAFHVSAYLVLRDLGACQAFPVPFMTAGAVRIVIFGTTGTLYVAAWIEFIRMLRDRWWGHWGTLASDTDPCDAARPIPVHIKACALLAVIVGLLILGCEACGPDQAPVSGEFAGVLSGIGGAVFVQFGAWFIRVCEPFLPINRPGAS